MDMSPPLESREPRNIVLSKFCSEIDRKLDVHLIACVSGSWNTGSHTVLVIDSCLSRLHIFHHLEI